MKSYQEFFAELKRRKVFRVAAVYGVTAFVLLQAADLLVEALKLPADFLTMVTVLMLLGFPVALILAWAFEVTPEGVRKTEAAATGEIERIVAQPASQRWPAGLMALVGIAALVAGAWWVGRQSSTASDSSGADSAARLAFIDQADDSRPSIAVLPFDDLSPEGDQAYFSDGMTEEILNVLAKVREMRVAARTSTFALRDRELTATQWGDTLGVGYLVEGSVRKAGDQLRITAQLIDTSNGSHLWSDNFDRPLANVFEIQSEIAEKIAQALAVPLGLEEGESLTTPTADLEAYDLYLAGRQQMRIRGEGVAEAVTLFEAAIARDSTWAPAWAGLAESRSLIPYYTSANDSVGWAVNLDAAEIAARRALELDPDNASALVALGSVHRDRWDWDLGEEAYLSALEIDPDNVEAHQQYAEHLYFVGRLDEAVREAQTALALDRSPIRLYVVGYTSSGIGRYNQAIEVLEEGIRRDPEERVMQLRGGLRNAYFEGGRWDKWWDGLNEMFGEIAEIIPDSMRGEFLDRRDELLAAWPEGGPPPEDLDIGALEFLPASPMRLAILLGQYELALELAEGTRVGRHPYGPPGGFMRPLYDPIREDPRFQALLERRGLGDLEPDPASRAAMP